ncbi:MAG: hypothetical protein K5649_08280 [Lachnospiraceae bacterium]|nr:hypothetical protein [Lachnospiraceae bacterium]
MELEILSRRMKPQETEPPVITAPPKGSAIEQGSILLTIAPSFTMALPMLLGFYLMYRGNKGMGTGYMTMGLTTAVGSALLGTLWALINYSRRRAKMRFAQRLRKRSYRAYLQQCAGRISEQIRVLENLERNADPPFDEWIDITRRRVRCIREIPDDKSCSGRLRIRLGTGSQVYPITMERSSHFAGGADILEREAQALIERLQILKQVPVYLTCSGGMCVDLITDRFSDLVGQFQMLVIRCALTYHESYVKIAFCLQNPILMHKLAWLNFAPHVIPHDEPNVLREICENAIILVFAEDGVYVPNHLRTDPRTVIIRMRMSDEGAEGIRMENGNAVCVLNTETFHGLINEEGERIPVLFDQITDEMAELAARALCRLRESPESGRDLPAVYPIFRMIPKETLNIEANWRHTDVLHSLKVPLGISYDGKITCLDAHDKRDGPHGLIAGMTGSGKSELLMTYILSLAVKYPPWEVAFFLIDYKGGGMSSAFSHLPHVIGTISNLSGHTTARAFLSIRSENERRQRLFLETNVNHISDYHRKYYEGTCSEALPHIFLIVDEFAQLKNEEPEFMQELIGLSRVGRSLGIHLLLCTQKPSGSVDSTIMTNARFQIALRLQDPLDSKEILHHPDAADLRNPGRAILRIGNDEVYETFQGAYALSPAQEGARRHVYPADVYGRLLHEGDREGLLHEGDRGRVLYAEKFAEPAGGGISSAGAGGGISSMEWILRSIAQADAKIRAAGHYPVFTRSLWLEELPETMHFADLAERIGRDVAIAAPDTAPGSVVIGLYDDPVAVKQGLLFLDYHDGHHLICGGPRSGKSTLLCVFLAGLLCQAGHPKVYVFDFGGGMLQRICARHAKRQEAAKEQGTVQRQEAAQLHCVAEDAADRIEPVLLQLQEETDAVILIDGIGALLKAGGFGAGEVLTELLRSGARRNLSLFISANGIGMGEMSQMMHTYMDKSLCLRMSDAFRYAEVLKETRFKGAGDLPPGRGYVKAGERVVEFQTLRESEETDDFYGYLHAGYDEDAFSAG